MVKKKSLLLVSEPKLHNIRVRNTDYGSSCNFLKTPELFICTGSLSKLEFC